MRRRVTLQVEKSYRDLKLAKETTTTARAALEQARETRRVDGDRYIVGVSLASEDWRTKAGEASAQANLLRADLNYLLGKGNWMWRPESLRNRLRRGCQRPDGLGGALCCIAAFGLKIVKWELKPKETL